MATATRVFDDVYKDKLGELYREANKAVSDDHPRVGVKFYLEAAQFAKDHGKEKDMLGAAENAKNLCLKLSAEMKKMGFLGTAQADYNKAVSIAERYGLEKPK